MDKVSVVLCVYNGENYIEESMRSILNQSYKNIELLVCNDGSTDGSMAIVNKLSLNDDRVIVINKGNEGLTKSLNLALTHVTGDWVARQDADDISDKYRIEKQLIFCKENSVDFCTSKAFRFKGEGEMIDIVPSNAKKPFTNKVLKYGNLHIHGTFFFKREIIDSIKYNEKLKVAQDFGFILDVINRGFKCALLNEPLYYLRLHDGSISHGRRDLQIKSVISSLKKHSLSVQFLIEGSSGVKRKILSIIKRVEMIL